MCDVLSVIIFLYGEDNFRSREKLAQLREAYISKNPDRSGLFEFDFDGADADEAVRELFRTLETGGLFASKKLVIAKRALTSNEAAQQKLLEHFEKTIERMEKDVDTVLVLWEENLPKKTHKLFRLLTDKVEKKQNFEPLIGTKLEQWSVTRLREMNPKVQIERRALLRLLAETESDLFRLRNELEKLAFFREEGTISDQDMDIFIAASPKEAVFEALEALTQGRQAQALDLFARQIQKGENALYLLSMCAWQLRNLLRVADMYTSGVREASAIAKELKIHPFVVQKLLRQIPHFPLDRLKKSFSLLTHFDLQSKSGGIDPKLALDLFVMRF